MWMAKNVGNELKCGKYASNAAELEENRWDSTVFVGFPDCADYGATWHTTYCRAQHIRPAFRHVLTLAIIS